MASPSIVPSNRCPDCGGTLHPIELVARGPETMSGPPPDAVVRYYANSDADRVRMGNESRASGHVRVTLCDKCHRIFMHGMPNILGTPAKVEVRPPAQGAISIDEPLSLERDASDGFNYLRVDHEGSISIIQVLTERVGVPSEHTYIRIGQEFTTALETCHARTVLDLGSFVPTQHASAFVTTLIKLKKRWLEKHHVPDEGKTLEAKAGESDGAKGGGQPTVKQLSFPVYRTRPLAISSLTALPDGQSEMVLCGVPQPLVDVLKVTRLLRAPTLN
ncbi:MAG: hypothetical protein U0939_15655 [Pirellulales bacterium]